MVPVGDDNKADFERGCGLPVDCVQSGRFPSTINYVKEQPISKMEIFDDYEKKEEWAVKKNRLLGWFLLFIGTVFMVMPDITALTFIPLVDLLIK
jgi:hypothetical protein